MAAGGTCVAHAVDTVHHEMDSAVHNQHVYKSLQSTGCQENNLSQRRSLPANLYEEFTVHGSDKGFSDSWPHFVRNLFTDHVVLYNTKGLYHLPSGICHITGRRRKGKGLELPCKYNYYCRPTKDPVLIRDPAFIFVIMVFSPATKQGQAFIQDWL